MRAILAALLLTVSVSANAAVPPLDDATRTLLRDVYKELVEINTTDSAGDNTKAAEAMAARLKAAGFTDVDVLVSAPRKGNLIARFKGTGKQKPLLLLAHLDVVEARREDWSTDPFKLVEQDGWFYGRGSADDKAMAAIWIVTLIRMKQAGFVPNRDIIVALTSDEETGGPNNGVSWLLANHRDKIDAGLAINEGGGGAMRQGKYLFNGIGASEKVYVTFGLEVKNKGGHSSVPQKINAIYQLAEALVRLSRYQFPVKLNEVTRNFFLRMSAVEEDPQVAADMRALGSKDDPAAAARLSEFPPHNARLRTTCVATMLQGGHAENALPQSAKATINCRILPGEDAEEVKKTLVSVLAEPAIEVTWIQRAKPSVPSPLDPAIMTPVEQVTGEFWPGIPVIPQMGTGASDSLYLRNAGIPSYGVSGLFNEIGESRAHGRDERVGVQQLYDATQFLYELVRRLSS